jgi:ADP-ribose pyrophosphatase
MNSSERLAALTLALQAMGAPPHKCEEMAAQLDKRAHQLAEEKRPNLRRSDVTPHRINAPGLVRKRTRILTSGNAFEKMNSVKPWKTVSSKPAGDFRIFKIRSDKKMSPRTGEAHDFFVLETVNWVNVIALTRDGKAVMVEQYRHGSDTIELEAPGGMMDPEDGSPMETAVRELMEETGYEGDMARLIGEIYPNPAIMNNTCYTVLVEGCELRHKLKFDQTEDIATKLIDLADIPNLVAEGKIGHSLVVVAFYHYEQFCRRSGRK